MSKPIIGVTANILVNEGQAFPGLRRIYVNEDYLVSITLAGGIPVILPVLGDPEEAARLVDGLDGLLISGGADVHPLAYGEEPHPLLDQTFPDRDKSDFVFLVRALGLGLPVLGICRGFQVINVHFGGTLYQDLSLGSLAPPVQHRQPATDRRAPGHSVKVQAGSRVFAAYGAGPAVNTFHHQGIKTLGQSLIPTARAPDGLVEAVEGPGPSYLTAVQWHPEMLAADGDVPSRNLFQDFVRESQKPRITGAHHG